MCIADSTNRLTDRQFYKPSRTDLCRICNRQRRVIYVLPAMACQAGVWAAGTYLMITILPICVPQADSTEYK